MEEKPFLYFKTDTEWYEWLLKNHNDYQGVYLIFYKVATKIPSMRWEEAVKVALCFGWIDATVKSLGDGKRQQYFCPRKPKSVWSKVNKNYVEALISQNLMHKSGLRSIQIAKENGSWTSLDSVENLIIPEELQIAFDNNLIAFSNYKKFPPSAKKSFLYWLFLAKREETRKNRIAKIIEYCNNNIKRQR